MQGLPSEVDKIRKTIFCDAMEKDLSPLAMFLTKGDVCLCVIVDRVVVVMYAQL
jgi:hypothetical protein